MEYVYFGNKSCKMIYLLIIYDISNDKRRTKFMKMLDGYGQRVQYSAFECWLDSKKHAELLLKINKIVSEEDNIRIYYLSKECEKIGSSPNNNIICDMYIC